MKRCPTSGIISELQIKTMMKYTIHLLKWSKSKNTAPNAGKDVKQQELSFTAGGNAKQYIHFGS